MKDQQTKNSTILLIAGVVFIIWSILGMIDAKNYTYDGYNTDDNFTVIKIEEGSPAEQAGLQLGDVLISTGGIAVTDSKALNERQRATIGESREIVVDRNGEETITQLTYAELTDRDKNLNRFGNILGLLFIIIGLYSNYKFKSELSFAFAVFAICFGFIFTGGPYFSSAILGSIIGILRTAVVLFSFTALAIFMLKYPPVSSFLSSKNYRMIFLPMTLLIVIITVLEVTQMDRSGVLNLAMRLLFGAFIVFYFGMSLITLIRKYMRSSSEERNTEGLTMMLIGAVLGLLPILVYFTVGLISQGTELPGNDYVFITFAAIPVFFYLALHKLHASKE
jgi:hypothetical protein